ncbi:uncharacterized protein LOC144157980 isoform X2 [Haemaphysalis longicornis]
MHRIFLASLPRYSIYQGVIRLGQICESSLECRSGCCLYNRTARAFTCQRENQRYSNCSPRRPKILWGSFLDVYLHHCPCKPHLRCVREHTWHVCEKREQPHVIPKPQGQKPIDERRPPQQKPPVKPPVKPPRRPPHWSPGVGTYNGTLGLGAPCATSIDCKSECCMYNPRVGFSYCHRQEQIYDDCTPWHPNDEKGTLVDVYFRHCPCSKNLRCTKEKKLHICRKKEQEFGTERPSQQQPVQQPNVQMPQLDSQKPLQERPVEVTAVGVPETHPEKHAYTGQIPLRPGTTQQQQIETPQSEGQKPLPPSPPPTLRPVQGKPGAHVRKPHSEQQQEVQKPLFEEQTPLPRPPLLKPEARRPGLRRRKPGRKTRKPRPRESSEQQQVQTPTPGEQTPSPIPPLQKSESRKPGKRSRKPSKKPLTQELVDQQQRQTPMPGTQNPLPTQTSETAQTREAEQVPTQKPLQQKPSRRPMKQKKLKKKKKRNSSEEDR